jgi:hypothetical protein
VAVVAQLGGAVGDAQKARVTEHRGRPIVEELQTLADSMWASKPHPWTPDRRLASSK